MKTNPIKEGISELVESKIYRKDFRKLIKKIISKESRKISKFIIWHWPQEWDGDFNKVTHDVSLDQFKNIVKSRKINQSWILIPNSYFRFKNRWQIEYFFDPSSNFPDDFDPFRKRFCVRPCYPPMPEEQFDKLIKKESEKKKTNAATPGQIRYLRILWNRLYNGWNEDNQGHGDSAFKLFLEIDVRAPLKAIFKKVEEEIKAWRDDLQVEIQPVKGRPKDRCSKLVLMKEIWQRNCEGKRQSGMQQSKIISDALAERGERINETTVYRHYLPIIKKADKK